MTVTIGLIGCGSWGKNILRDLCALECRVMAADLSPSARTEAMRLGAGKVFPCSDDLPTCDGYVIATPIPSLAREAVKMIPRGAPIFSEKTLCPTRAQADELFEAGGRGKIFVMHKWEYHRGIQTLASIADSGRIGRLEQVSCVRYGWRTGDSDDDVLTRLAVHDLTIVRHILGAIPSPTFCMIRKEKGVPIALWAVLGESPHVVLSVDWRHPVHTRSVALNGTRGAALLAGAYSDYITVRDESGEELVHFENTLPLYEELKEFVEYLKGGRPPRCGLDHAADAAIALDALRNADRSGIDATAAQ